MVLGCKSPYLVLKKILKDLGEDKREGAQGHLHMAIESHQGQ